MSTEQNKTSAKTRVAEELAAIEAAKKRAARQAATVLADPVAVEKVTCRVLPMGDGKISMGIHVPGVGEAHFEKGETFECEKPIAQSLEGRGYVEITA